MQNDFILPNEFARFNLTIPIIKDLISRYAPIRHLHSKTKIFPCSYDYLWEHFTPHLNDTIKKYELLANFKLRYSGEFLTWFRGQALGTAPTYIYLRKETPDEFIIDFHTLLAYNKGKYEIGNHVMDNSRCWIVFNIDRMPIKLGYVYHGMLEVLDWEVASKPPYVVNGDKQVIFTGLDSNETYLVPGDIYYKQLTILGNLKFNLVDHTDYGPSYDTGANYVLITPTNYYGKSNVAITRNGTVSLAISNLIPNWTSCVAFMGHKKIGIKLFGTKIDFLSGLNKLPVHQFRQTDSYKKIKYTW